MVTIIARKMPTMMEVAEKFFRPVRKSFLVSNPARISTSSLKNSLKLAPDMKYAESASLDELNALKKIAFSNPEKIGMTKKDYYYLIDKISEKVKLLVQENPQGLRKELVDNADKLHKWSEIFATQTYKDGKNIYESFYDEKIFNQAVQDYTKFLESMTGRRVLNPCPSRMNVCAAGLLNDPEVYRNADVILIGHGHNSSLITDLSNPKTWRFSDNEKSIWEFIEQNTSQGDEVLVFCCETDGLKLAGKTAGMLVDKSGNKMLGIGDFVDLSGWRRDNPIKICKNGTRHIIGHVSTEAEMTDIAKSSYPYNLSCTVSSNRVYYDL